MGVKAPVSAPKPLPDQQSVPSPASPPPKKAKFKYMIFHRFVNYLWNGDLYFAFLGELDEISCQVWYQSEEFLRRLNLPQKWSEPFWTIHTFTQLWLIRAIDSDHEYWRNRDGVFSN